MELVARKPEQCKADKEINKRFYFKLTASYFAAGSDVSGDAVADYLMQFEFIITKICL